MTKANLRKAKTYALTLAAVLAACNKDVTVPRVTNSTPATPPGSAQ